MFSRRSKVLGLWLALSDLAIMVLAFELAYAVRQYLPALRPFYLERGVFVGLLASVLAIWWTVGTGVGIYRRPELFDTARIMRDTLRQGLLGTAVLMGWLYLLKLGHVSRLFILLFVIITTALLLGYRLSARSLRRQRRRDTAQMRYCVIVGTGASAVEVARLIEASEDLGGQVLAFVRERPGTSSNGPGAEPTALEADGLRQAYPIRELQQLSQMLQEHVVDEIIFAVSKQDLEQMGEIFLACEEEGVKARVLVNFFPHLSSEIYLENLQSLPMLTFSTTPEDEYLLSLKRVFDVGLASLLLVVLAPLFLLLAAAIRLTSPGPVIFSQERCGLNGRRFRLHKFRSMYRDAVQRLSEVVHLNEMDGPVFKCARDPRATPVGRLLRKFSVDEWPQLFNILKGDMSFVGPRPPLLEEVRKYERWQRRRLRMKPGLTCLWALEGRNNLDFLSWIRLDLHYIDHWSFLLDLKILLRTIPHVLSGKGA